MSNQGRQNEFKWHDIFLGLIIYGFLVMLTGFFFGLGLEAAK